MNKKQFWKHINSIQTFMGLDNWQLNYRFDDIEEENVSAQCDTILYSYFKVAMTFDKELLKDDDEIILETIFHELAHIYTTQSLEIYESESDFIKGSMWTNSYVHIKDKMVIVNEQQTELLARRFKELYLNK